MRLEIGDCMVRRTLEVRRTFCARICIHALAVKFDAIHMPSKTERADSKAKTPARTKVTALRQRHHPRGVAEWPDDRREGDARLRRSRRSGCGIASARATSTLGITGISHWVEHMLFKGTPTYSESRAGPAGQPRRRRAQRHDLDGLHCVLRNDAVEQD